MLDSHIWMLLAFFWRLIEEFGPLIFLAVVAAAVHLRLRARVTRLEQALSAQGRSTTTGADSGAGRDATASAGGRGTRADAAATRSPWGDSRSAAATPGAAASIPGPDSDPGRVSGPDSTSPPGTAPASDPASVPARGPAATGDAAPRRPPSPATDPESGSAPGRPRPTATPFTETLDTGFLAGFFRGGNWLVRGGVLVLFLGVGFLLKFAADNALLPVQLRLAGVGAGGAFLVWLGLRLAPARRAYALTLQGGGVGLLYLTLYAAFRLYALLPASAAFVLMLVVVAGAGFLAVRQNALILAVLGAVGGFAAPLLASTGSGSHVLLFSYYVVLNTGVLGLALFRAWRPLNLVGFVATFGISAVWGANVYSAAHFATVEPFLVLFFAMYLGIAVLFALTRSLQLHDPLDSTLVFGTPLVVFGLQSQLLADSAYGLAITAAALAVTYGLAAWLLRRRAGDRLAVLVEAFIALAVGFAALAPALALDARWTAASWALEGAALVWVGWRQDRPLARIAGAVLQLLAGCAFLWHGASQTRWETGDWLGTLMLAAAGLLSGAVLDRVRARPAAAPEHGGGDGDGGGDPAQRLLATGLGLWGLLWWLGGGLVQIDEWVTTRQEIGAMLLFLAATAAALEVAGKGLVWRLPRQAALLLPCALILVALAQLLVDDHPMAALAVVGWPGALAVCALVLWRHETGCGPLAKAMHPVAFWLLAGLGAWECAYWFADWMAPVRSWQRLGWLLPPATLVVLVAVNANRAGRWPLTRHGARYLTMGAGPLLCGLAGGFAALSVADPGPAWPIAYLPVLNPLDAGLLFVLAAALAWLRACREVLGGHTRTVLAVCAAGFAFLWLNGALLRTLHFWWDVPHRLDAMLSSTLTQASMSVLWASTALVTMVSASRAASRALWQVGAALIAVVVLKLMLVDLASSGTIARIVSFISVGLLLMLVGYLAPVPPRVSGDRGGEGSGQ